ncbi:MAG: enoyl-CoA hydratase/isomerase family protein [Gammaproteobacteria bacterium]|nr:enoyl-CoA hydratase/isomerase family protein [Gammaproteobacteria bacterium]
MSGAGLVMVEQRGATAWIVLNRAEKKNALSDAMLDELLGALHAAVDDAQVRSIVLKGAGGCFSAGRDIKEFGAERKLQDQSLDAGQAGFLQVLSLLSDAPKPTIAAVHGIALGGGQAISLACDFVVAERGARFGNVEMLYGFPAAMNIALLARHLGRRMGLEIAMSGQTYEAERYQQIGLVNRLADPGELEQETEKFAALFNERTPWSVARTKSTFRLAEDMSLQAGLHTGNQLNQLLMLASQTNPVHSGGEAAKAAVKQSEPGSGR